MEILDNLLGEQADKWKSKLTGSLGFDADSAGKFIPALMDKLKGALGGFDVSDLLGKLNPKELMGKIDIAGLADKAGVSTEQAQKGVEGLLPDVTEGLTEKLGGMGDLKEKAGGLLGGLKKLF